MNGTHLSSILCLSTDTGGTDSLSDRVMAMSSRFSPLAYVFLLPVFVAPVLCEATGNDVLFDFRRTRQTFDGFGVQISAFNNNPDIDLAGLLQQASGGNACYRATIAELIR